MRSLIIAAILTSIFLADAEAAPLKVVASFSILGDLVKQVGGDDVTVTTLVGPNGDAHEYEPKPSDAVAIGAADMLVVNGLGLEGWMDRLLQTVNADSASRRITVVASEKVKEYLLPNSNRPDPHAWQSVSNAMKYTAAIEAGLVKVDPAHADYYHQRARTYIAQLKTLNGELQTTFLLIPLDRRIVITTHDAFGYYGRQYEITFLAPEGLSTESEASPQAVAALIHQIKERHVTAVFIENMSDSRLVKQIASETGVDVSGVLYSDALSPTDGPASTYIDMVRYNTGMLAKALGSNPGQR